MKAQGGAKYIKCVIAYSKSCDFAAISSLSLATSCSQLLLSAFSIWKQPRYFTGREEQFSIVCITVLFC